MGLYSPLDEVLWYLPPHHIKQLRSDVSADVVIIGGGMAGLTAAQAFAKKGCSVIVLEKSFCGAGASGKSSGFITPDSEFSLGSFVERYGPVRSTTLMGVCNFWSYPYQAYYRKLRDSMQLCSPGYVGCCFDKARL